MPSTTALKYNRQKRTKAIESPVSPTGQTAVLPLAVPKSDSLIPPTPQSAVTSDGEEPKSPVCVFLAV
jgi:hypothetical protein